METSTSPLRIAVVGLGRIAQAAHLPALARCDAASLAGLYDPRAHLAARLSDRYAGAPLFPSLEALLAEDAIEAVVVCVPTPEHERIATAVLEAGKHVLVEKPLALTAVAGRRLLETAERNERRLMVGYHKRYDPGCLQARDWLPEIGTVTHALYRFGTTDWLAPASEPLLTRQAADVPGDAWDWPARAHTSHRRQFYALALDMFSHMTNLLRWLTGEHPRVDWARAGERIEKQAGAVRATLALSFGEATALLIDGPHYPAAPGWNERCELWGPAGRIDMEFTPHVDPEASARVRLWSAASGKMREAETVARWAFAEQLSHFACALRTGEPFRTEARDALIDVELAEEALEKLACSSV